MILDRQYKPTGSELIYHYCRLEAFVEIVISQTMWHTAHYVLNDSMEREWGYSIFTKAANRLREKVGNDFIERVDAILDGGVEGASRERLAHGEVGPEIFVCDRKKVPESGDSWVALFRNPLIRSAVRVP